jgi:hypothetical protein
LSRSHPGPGKAAIAEVDPSGLVAYPGKSCGGCTACCMTVPVKEIGLRAFERCRHLHSLPQLATGCSIHANRPRSCRAWSCSWLISDLPDEYRPDRIGVVVDPIPDLVRIHGEEIVASQLWVLPGHEDDWRTVPAVKDLIQSIMDLGFAILWRIKAEDGQLARVMVHHRGKWMVSEPDISRQEMAGFADDGERLRHAQTLIARPS